MANFLSNLVSGFAKEPKEALMGKTIEAPQAREAAQINEATQNLMGGQAERAGMSNEDIAAESMRGVSKDSAPMFNDMGMMQGHFGGAANPMMTAIQNKQAKKYTQDVNALQKQAEYKAPIEKANRMNTVMENKLSQARALAGAADIDRQNRLASWQFDQQQKAARNSLIASVLGIGMKAGAMALTGGAAAPAMAAPPARSQNTDAAPMPTGKATAMGGNPSPSGYRA